MLLRIAGMILYLYYGLLRLTVSLEIRGREAPLAEIDAGRVPVFAITHASSVVALLAWKGYALTVLASKSKDGEFAARFLERLGCTVVRGSSSRGGKEAMVELRSAVRKAPVAITFDGPRGPALVPKPGVGALAFESGGELYFVSIRNVPRALFGERLCIRLHSWDRFFLPLPFARFEICFAQIPMPPRHSCSAKEWIDAALAAIEREARAAYG